MNWPEAFAIVGSFGSLFGLLAWLVWMENR